MEVMDVRLFDYLVKTHIFESLAQTLIMCMHNKLTNWITGEHMFKIWIMISLPQKIMTTWSVR